MGIEPKTLLWSDCRPNSGPVSGRPQRTPPSSGGPPKSRRRFSTGNDGRDTQCNNSVRPRSSVVGDSVQLCEGWSSPRMPPLRLATRTQRPAGETRRQLLLRGGRAPGGLLCARSHPLLDEWTIVGVTITCVCVCVCVCVTPAWVVSLVSQLETCAPSWSRWYTRLFDPRGLVCMTFLCPGAAKIDSLHPLRTRSDRHAPVSINV